ncbi:hypothetical protein [Bacteroides mediterraneensis]|uniref:hypothetical protein n=1 Tax=Bacteroides mediterraneensis TaxID=1841856 RepID=UPI0026EFA8A7|nr:hypothetical protein [Bacteroides mediterraneensis]
MKRLILFCIWILFILPMQIQARKYFCEIKGMEKGNGLLIVFDFGESPVYSTWKGLKSDQQLVDENGKEIKFNSMVDAANYMSEKEWNFLQAYTSMYAGNVIQHWIFYKEADSQEEAGKGIMTKENYKKLQK